MFTAASIYIIHKASIVIHILKESILLDYSYSPLKISFSFFQIGRPDPRNLKQECSDPPRSRYCYWSNMDRRPSVATVWAGIVWRIFKPLHRHPRNRILSRVVRPTTTNNSIQTRRMEHVDWWCETGMLRPRSLL